MKWKVDPDDPHKPTFHYCIRCLRQFKLSVPYVEAVPINRDFCDDCITDMPYEEREKFALEAHPPMGDVPMEFSALVDEVLPLKQ